MAESSVSLKAPADCTPGEKKSFYDLVVAGGEVKPAYARTGIARAENLAFAYVGNALAGVGCLKNPGNEYRRRVFEKSRSRLDPGDFKFEVGYIVVDEKFRGNRLSRKITAALIEGVSSNLFATSAVEKTRMHASLMHLGFKREGNAYESADEPGKMLFLFIKA